VNGDLRSPRRTVDEWTRDWWRARRSSTRRLLGWSAVLVAVLGIQFLALSLLTSSRTAFDVALGLQSPLGNSNLSSAGERALGVALALTGFLLLPAVVGLAVSATFESSLDAAVRRRMKELDDAVQQSRGDD